jgi:peptidoglycan-associated lipoprotein
MPHNRSPLNQLLDSENSHMRSIWTPAVTVCVAALLGACSSTPVTPTAAPAPAKPVAAAPAAPAQPAPAAASSVASVALPAYLDPKSPISQERSVYFAFDDYKVQPKYNGLIELQGKYLADHAAVKVRVEGNCDERGSAEYNLALGQRRADAVVKALELVGAHNGQLEAISWGEEKPKALGHDEAAWAENRRVDLVYPAH